LSINCKYVHLYFNCSDDGFPYGMGPMNPESPVESRASSPETACRGNGYRYTERMSGSVKFVKV